MSQYLNIFLKKKDSDISVSLYEFCTTPARQISSLGAFPYTESDKLLTKSSIESYLSIITEERDNYKHSLEIQTTKKSLIEQDFYKCVSKEVAQMVLENIEEMEQYISELKELVDEWNWYIKEISFAVDVWNNNKEEWDLYYNNR